MAIDPLSPATRTAKRNLLVVSILAITYKAFNITIENIPIEGLNIRFDKGAFAFLLLSGAVYFGVTFLFYYLIDIKNIEETPHQQNTKQKFQDRILLFRNNSMRALDQKVSAVLIEPYYLSGRIYGSTDRLLQSCENAEYEINEAALQLGTHNSILNIASRNIGGGDALNPTSHRDVYERPIQITIEHLQEYRRRIRLYRSFLMPWLASVKFMYAARNYGTDGIFPIALALLAIAAMYDIVNIQWIARLLPSSVGQ